MRGRGCICSSNNNTFSSILSILSRGGIGTFILLEGLGGWIVLLREMGGRGRVGNVRGKLGRGREIGRGREKEGRGDMHLDIRMDTLCSILILCNSILSTLNICNNTRTRTVTLMDTPIRICTCNNNNNNSSNKTTRR